MSTAPAHDPAHRAPWRTVPVTWRDTPPAVWVLATGWSVACWGLLAPWLPQWSASPGERWSGDTLRDFTAALAVALGPLLSLMVSLAPLATLVRPWLGLLLGLAGLVPAIGADGVAGQFSGYLSLVGVTAMGTWRRGRPQWAVLAMGLLPPALYCFSNGSYDLVLAGAMVSSGYYAGQPGALARNATTWGMYLGGALVLVGAGWLVCRAGRWRVVERREMDAERAAIARERFDLGNEAAVVDERSRLARDLHDVVAHRISLVAVRAETAPFKHPGIEEPVRDEFTAIAVDARTALDEMRQVLGVLHRSQDAGTRVPQPGVADIATLVEESRAAGAAVEVSGGLPDLPGTTGTVVHRVVQEALTNARRHGRGPVALDLRLVEGHVCVHVENPCDPGHGVVVGRGLGGMRERVELVGGSLSVSVHDGRFVLVADIPIAGADDTEPTVVTAPQPEEDHA